MGVARWAFLWAVLILFSCMPALAQEEDSANGVSQDQYRQSGSGQKANDNDADTNQDGAEADQGEAEADQGEAEADQGGGSCANPEEVASAGPTTDNSVTPFTTTGRTFRVSYTVSGIDPDEFETVDIDVEDRFGLVDFATVDEDGTGSFIVTEEAGSFELVVNVSPQNSAEYTVSVEDCGGTGSGNGADPNDDQYDNGDGDVDDPDDVVGGPGDGKPLPNTGGAPVLFGAVALALASALLTRRILAP